MSQYSLLYYAMIVLGWNLIWLFSFIMYEETVLDGWEKFCNYLYNFNSDHDKPVTLTFAFWIYLGSGIGAFIYGLVK